MFVLPGERLSCHRRSLEALASRELDTSAAVSGPHDFAVRFMLRSSVAACAPIASPRTFVTIASAPHLWGGDELKALICRFGKAEYFCDSLLTDFG
jgi:hypothetical protein